MSDWGADGRVRVLKGVRHFRRKIRRKMDLMFDAYLNSDGDFPTCDSPVWIFGRSYSVNYGEIKISNLSRIRLN